MPEKGWYSLTVRKETALRELELIISKQANVCYLTKRKLLL